MKILHPTDFSSVAGKALDVANHLARRLGASVHVLHVQQRFETGGAPSESMTATALDERAIRREREAREEQVRRWHERLRHLASDAPNGTWELRWGHPVREIVDAAKTGVDLVVMGAHGSNRLDAYFLGGVAGRVVRRSRVPVVTVREEVPRTNIDHVVMATDFGDASRHAWHWLRSWSATGIRTSLVHVADDPRFAEDEGYLRSAHEALDAMVDGRATPTGIVPHAEVRVGDPIDVLPAVAAEWGADAICVGTRRRPAAAGLVFGSRADALVRSSVVPVLSVPYGD